MVEILASSWPFSGAPFVLDFLSKGFKRVTICKRLYCKIIRKQHTPRIGEVTKTWKFYFVCSLWPSLQVKILIFNYIFAYWVIFCDYCRQRFDPFWSRPGPTFCRSWSGPKGGGGTLIFSYIRRLGSLFWVQNFEFQYFWGFSEKIIIFGVWSFCGYFWGVITTLCLYLVVISMHHRVFS